MDAIRDGWNLIAGGGWNGLLLGGFALLAIMVLLTVASNRYAWGIALIAVAAFIGWRLYGAP